MSFNAGVKSLGDLLGNNAFTIPDFQRSYAWEVRERPDAKDHQIDDFWNDLQCAFSNSKANTQSPQQYYWGTVTVKKETATLSEGFRRFPIYSIVDGQQRITTASLLLIAFERALNNLTIREYLLVGPTPRLKAGLLNRNTLEDLIKGTSPVRDIHLRTNVRLTKALAFFERSLAHLLPDEQRDLLNYFLHSTICLEFDTGDERLAIQAFLSLNDRGKPLTILETFKGVLAGIDLYSIGALASLINDTFAKVYVALDKANAIGDAKTLKYFRELDDNGFFVLLYHYTAPYLITRFSVNSYVHSCWASAREALEFFRAVTLYLVTTKGIAKASSFLKVLLQDVQDVADAVERLASKSNSSSSVDLYKLFAFLGVTPWLMPVLIGAEIHNHLTREFLEAIETTDVRVFKVGGLERVAPLYTAINPLVRKGQVNNIIDQLRAYRRYWAPDSVFSANVATLYGRAADNYVLWEYQKQFASDSNISFNELDHALFQQVTIEHIFAQTPAITFPAAGFNDGDEYAASNNMVGNLTLLEHREPNLQQQADNKPPTDKARDVYPRSRIPDVQSLSRSINAHGFSKQCIDARTAEFQAFALKRWA